jgi:hypothetical protein
VVRPDHPRDDVDVYRVEVDETDGTIVVSLAGEDADAYRMG